MNRTTLLVRSLFLLGFVVAMPLLAFPRVARWADEILYGDAPPAPTAETPADVADEEDGQVVHAVLETPLGSPLGGPSPGSQGRGLDAVGTQPPEMPPSPNFPASPFEPPLEGRSQDVSTDRLAEIRQRLEDLGAEYLRVELVAGTGQYNCQCRMLLAPGSPQTETFEASGKDAIAVAEQVLAAVETWRSDLASPSP